MAVFFFQKPGSMVSARSKCSSACSNVADSGAPNMREAACREAQEARERERPSR
jgi:hypothetical protein